MGDFLFRHNLRYNKKMPYKPVVLIVLDGVGVNIVDSETPFSLADIPTWHEMERMWPFTTLRASGVAVGLPWGEEGNSEVGHLAMGSGRVIYHHLPRIIAAIQDGSFFQNPALKKAADHVRARNSTLHFMGLFSTGSVHAYIDHLYALLDFAKQEKIERVMLHLFTDGRDAPQDEAAGFMEQFEERLKILYPNAAVASLLGRSTAMDRDADWARIQQAYRLLTQGEGKKFTDPVAYLKESYRAGVFDEFLEPACRADAAGKPVGRIQAGDAVVYFNFREDSERELTQAFLAGSLPYFEREKIPDLVFVTMTEYDKAFGAEVAFPPLEIVWPLAEVISHAHRTQLHVAETEKYAHVTYFFNGGRERPFELEERVLVPSPHAAHFNEHPEMGAEKITKTILEAVTKYDFILANFANGDMVGHTGDFDATIKALEALDASLARIIPTVLQAGGAVLVTGDHGNAEEKRYRGTGEPRTKHTINPVPFFLITDDRKRTEPRGEADIKKLYGEIGGVLTDMAPTILELMGLPKPGEMTGISLAGKLHNTN